MGGLFGIGGENRAGGGADRGDRPPQDPNRLPAQAFEDAFKAASGIKNRGDSRSIQEIVDSILEGQRNQLSQDRAASARKTEADRRAEEERVAQFEAKQKEIIKTLTERPGTRQTILSPRTGPGSTSRVGPPSFLTGQS